MKRVDTPPDHIVMYATPYCGDTRRARRVLDEKHVPYEFIDFRQDLAAARIVEEINNGYRSSPTIVFPDGSVLVEPSERELYVLLDRLAANGYVLEPVPVA